jgi:uncharacterized protein (DUF2141 family)
LKLEADFDHLTVDGIEIKIMRMRMVVRSVCCVQKRMVEESGSLQIVIAELRNSKGQCHVRITREKF